MSIVIRCPECNKSLKVGDSVAGKKVRCPGCKHEFTAPGNAEEEEGVSEGVATTPSAPKRDRADDEDRPARRERRDPDEDEDEDRPRRRRRDEDEEEEEEEDRPRRSRRDRDDEDDEAPRRKKRRR